MSHPADGTDSAATTTTHRMVFAQILPIALGGGSRMMCWRHLTVRSKRDLASLRLLDAANAPTSAGGTSSTRHSDGERQQCDTELADGPAVGPVSA
jgi:hypothetical protein